MELSAHERLAIAELARDLRRRFAATEAGQKGDITHYGPAAAMWIIANRHGA